MSSQAESRTVYAAGLVQDVVLVTFPAASTIFTEPSQYGLSSTQYGAMFLPRRSPRSLHPRPQPARQAQALAHAAGSVPAGGSSPAAAPAPDRGRPA